MKKTLILILTFLPLTLFGQNLKCCESEKEVETYISGFWKIKDSESKIRYQYWFEQGKGNLTEVELTDDENEYIVVDDHPFVEIIKYDNGFKLKYTDLSGSFTSELKYLNSKKMILVTDGNEVEYCKTSE